MNLPKLIATIITLPSAVKIEVAKIKANQNIVANNLNLPKCMTDMDLS